MLFGDYHQIDVYTFSIVLIFQIHYGFSLLFIQKLKTSIRILSYELHNDGKYERNLYSYMNRKQIEEEVVEI